MTLAEVQQEINKKPIVVTYFSHDECNVCKVLKPQVRELVGQYEDMHFVYVNTKENPEASGQFMVFAVPTVIIFFEGREAKRFSRHLSLQELRAFLERMLALATE